MSSRFATSEPRVVSTTGIALLAYSLVVSVLHFGGLHYGVYTELWWWDLLTHSLSGFGVAAWLWFVGAAPRNSTWFAVLPVIVLLVGAGFEVYEYLFKDFYVEWTLAYYLEDTMVDLVLDALGATAFVYSDSMLNGSHPHD